MANAALHHPAGVWPTALTHSSSGEELSLVLLLARPLLLLSSDLCFEQPSPASRLLLLDQELLLLFDELFDLDHLALKYLCLLRNLWVIDVHVVIFFLRLARIGVVEAIRGLFLFKLDTAKAPNLDFGCRSLGCCSLLNFPIFEQILHQSCRHLTTILILYLLAFKDLGRADSAIF